MINPQQRYEDQAAYFLRIQSNRDFLAWAARHPLFTFKDIRMEFLGVKSHPWVAEALEAGLLGASNEDFWVATGTVAGLLKDIKEQVGVDRSYAPNAEKEIDAQARVLAMPSYLQIYAFIESKNPSIHSILQSFGFTRDYTLTAIKHLRMAGLIRQKYEGLKRVWVATDQKMPGLTRYLNEILNPPPPPPLVHPLKGLLI